VADGLIEIDKHLIPEKGIHFILTRVMASAQSPYRAHFVCGVMVDVHIWVRSPTLKGPVDKSLECALFLGPVMCPPILEL
jgi:hypothetical protein